VKFAASGVLDDPDVFARIRRWPAFQRIQLGTICSDRAVGRTLRDLGQLPTPLGTSTSPRWWDGTGRNQDSGSRQSCQNRSLVTPEFMKKLAEGGPSERTEHLSLAILLRDTTFQAEDGYWHRPTDLLVPETMAPGEAGSDEILRAAFAPPHRRLNRAYAGQALQFFGACRERFEANTEVMAEWAWTAPTPETRIAALRYLLDPRALLRTEVAAALRERLRNERSNWLWGLELEPWWQIEFNESAQFELLWHVLRLRGPFVSEPRSPLPAANTPAILNAIYDWWVQEADRDTLIREYESRLYPGGQRPQLDRDPERLRHDTGTRKSWLVLWLLAGFHTIGRTREHQHRAFIEFCDEKGWLDVFANPECIRGDRRAGELLGVLDSYFENQTESSPFYHWFRQFVTIYKLPDGCQSTSRHIWR